MLEGEKALRTETARQIQETQRRLAAAMQGHSQEVLATKHQNLQEKIKQQSQQVCIRLLTRPVQAA